MDLYLAGLPASNPLMDYVMEFNKDKENKIGVMATFAQPRLFLKAVKKGFEKIMLDSGAYTVFNSGGTIDIDKLCDFIIENRADIKHAISLDVIGDEGWDSVKNWEYMQKERETEVLPVFHVQEDWAILDYYCERADYVAIGGMAGVISSQTKQAYFMEKIFTRHPGIKFHGLGVNDPFLVQRFPFYSVDALTWRNGSRFGQIITEHGRWNLGRIADWLDVEISGMKDWLTKHGLTYPFPEGFNYVELDKINIHTLYELMVEYYENNKVGTGSVYNLTLF